MTWPFLYLPGDRLSAAELSAARLDGDLVEVGEGFIPADALETRELRAASLRPLVGDGLVVTHRSAAWVHGARLDPPRRHSVQRLSATRLPHVIHGRLHYRDGRMPPADALLLGGIAVTTVARTLADLVRADVGTKAEVGEDAVALAEAFPGSTRAAADLLAAGPPVSFKRPALAWLRARLEPGHETTTTETTTAVRSAAKRRRSFRRQEEVTR